MRLLRLGTNYPGYLDGFYAARPGLADEGYAAQYRALMGDCCGWADFWTRALGPLGYECWEPVGNAEPMQKAWAREHGTACADRGWLEDIAVAQARHFRPDVLFVNDHSTYTAPFFRRLREACPSVRVVVGWCGAPYRDAAVFREYDLVLSNIPALVAHFRANGRRCERMRHAFEPSILERLGPRGATRAGFTFLGSIVKREGFHNRREELLARLVRDAGLEVRADVSRPTPRELADLRRAQRRFDFARRLASVPALGPLLSAAPAVARYAAMGKRPELAAYVDPAIAERAEPALYGLAMYRKLAESRVTLNTHIDIAAESASNMRLFEATGVGACLLTERQPDLAEVFAPDTEVATYGSADEAVEKARYLLGNDAARDAVAAAGQRRTLASHTFAHRARELDDHVRGLLR